MKPNKTDTAHIRFQEWERVARDDEEIIQIGLKENSSPNPLCFHAQQMAEKFLKGFLAYYKQPSMKVHQLDQLLLACQRIDFSFIQLKEAVLYLNEFYIETRYPGDYPEFTIEDAKQAYARASLIAEFVRSKISLPSSAHTHSAMLPALLLLTIFTASLFFAFAPGVARGQEAEKGSGEEATQGTGSERTQTDELREQRFGLNAVASLLGLTKCENPDYTKCPAPDLREVVLKLIQVALGFTSLIALIFVLYGGFIWVTAAGNAERVDKGRKILIWAGIGLFVVMFAWGLITYIIYTSSRVVA